ncbi:hypothetical protein ACFXK0_10855 [Nocardia sp. NPDC059177]|uniref:hypothetical protein n=1 Tax=Nocardia sp. NPDC059177 TaxID=3346759 RepID=UPI00369FDD43
MTINAIVIGAGPSGLLAAASISRFVDSVTVMIMPDITTGNPGRNAVLMPIEGGRWLVTLGATRGSTSPADDNEFMEFARHGLPHGLVGDLIADAEPLSDTWRSRSTTNRRYGFGNSSDLPPGLIVVGDAVAAFNRVYGHGLSFAARCALALRNAVQKYGPDPMRSPYVQSTIAETSQMPWQIATSQDSRYRETIGQPPTRSADIRHIFAHRIVQAAAERPAVAAAWIDIISLSRPTVTMANPALLMGALLGRRRPPRPDPPLTRVERQLLPTQR